MTIERKLVKTSGASAEAVYVEEVFQTHLYTGNGSTQTINNGIALGDSQPSSLTGLTITSLGGAFDSTSGFPITNLNDGVANGSNIGYVSNTNGYFDVYVDVGAGNSSVATEYKITPQGTTTVYNTPTDFIVKASNDATTWTTIATFTNQTSGWVSGSYKSFTFSNTTSYRYWRLQCTSYGSENSGVAISEWEITRTGLAGVGKGGLVWLKGRSGATDNALYDTARGATFDLASNLTSAQTTQSTGLTAFGTTGFTIGSLAKLNTNAATYASWTFRKQPKFFDVVTFTSDASGGASFSHALSATPGMVIIKSTSAAGGWVVWHKSLATNYALILSSTNAAYNNGAPIFSTLNSTSAVISNGSLIPSSTQVAYLFADSNSGGFGPAGTDSVVACGSYVGNLANDGPTITLGWEPQFVLVKNISSSGTNWEMADIIRGQSLTSEARLWANTSDSETVSTSLIAPTATGFKLSYANSWVNGNGNTHIYLAIRRGPMKTPTDATKVFAATTTATAASPGVTATTGFPVDLSVFALRNLTSLNSIVFDRLRGSSSTSSVHLATSSTRAEETWTANGIGLQSNTTVTENVTGGSGYNNILWNFRRAPGFFDVVCHTGSSSNLTVNHNLGVVPEIILVKRRDSATIGGWYFNSQFSATTHNFLTMNSTSAGSVDTYYNNNTIASQPTSTSFSVQAAGAANYTSTATYVAYLFASCPGVSKVGSYTGSGTTKQIDCGFTAGARFVLIKRTDSIGDWYVWDTARGIVSGNDPYFFLNTTAIEVANTDYIDPYSAGFEISSTAPAEINASGGTFIYLAIA